MKKIVKGNDFTMRVIVNKIVDGQQQPFSLPACEEVKAFAVGRYRRYELETRVDAKSDKARYVLWTVGYYYTVRAFGWLFFNYRDKKKDAKKY